MNPKIKRIKRKKNIMNEYLRAFVIGSSWLVFIHHFITVYLIRDIINYSYAYYSMIAPVYLGIMNAISIKLQKLFRLSNTQRYGYIFIISSIIVISFSYTFKTYPFTETMEWISYSIKIFIAHFFDYFIVMQFLDNYI